MLWCGSFVPDLADQDSLLIWLSSHFSAVVSSRCRMSAQVPLILLVPPAGRSSSNGAASWGRGVALTRHVFSPLDVLLDTASQSWGSSEVLRLELWKTPPHPPSEVTHWTRIREDSGSIPGPAILISMVFRNHSRRMLGWVLNNGHGRFLLNPSPIPLRCATCTVSDDLAVGETLSPLTGRSVVVVSLIASDRGEPLGFSHMGIVQDDVAGRRFSSGISRFPCIPELLRTHLASPSSALKTSMSPGLLRPLARPKLKPGTSAHPRSVCHRGSEILVLRNQACGLAGVLSIPLVPLQGTTGAGCRSPPGLSSRVGISPDLLQHAESTTTSTSPAL
ncbi:hypothetical protein PR048_007751 [Dryococelus australis]|uniref:Uncharacterized protein n=1 Tax=Dryococelus australis TaxID=614101 RepID=A0ABQ9HW05_9NEOP|nr:hypothetical protein PR048_007751 [Dryococelus australis]